MVLARLRRALGLVLIVTFFVLATGPLLGDSTKGEVVDRQLRSENIAHNKIGSDPVRKMAIYLPPGYDDAAKSNVRYPVIYFLPTPEASYRAAFDHEAAQHLFDRAVRSAIIDKFIFVAVDMATPLGCSWYVKSRRRSAFTPYLYGNRQCCSNPHCAGTYDPCADNGQPGDARAQRGVWRGNTDTVTKTSEQWKAMRRRSLMPADTTARSRLFLRSMGICRDFRPLCCFQGPAISC